ncbi:MAG: nicotinamide riboside transporter PnuC [Bacteroidales bacterium]|jgi:nicotinamide mononucleotide transporter|nr:nicotinamide riboside transporter PnuC [Bacteroidales bacterium]
MIQLVLAWFTNNYIEVSGTIFGLLYILLSIKQNIWCWPLGLITSAIYIYVFFVTKFYADMGLQVYYLIVSVYGWFNWQHGGKSHKQDDLKVSFLSLKLFFILLAATALFFVCIAYILINYTDSTIPYWDAFTTAASFVATWMLARKIIENWIFWIVIDFVSLGLYIYKGLYPTVVLFAVYTILAVVGYINWQKEIKLEVSI